jgi:predicted nucleic acid-binding protein
MGLILDSSILIAAERQGKNAHQVLTAIAEEIGETEIGVSVVTLIELAHGAARADTPQRKFKRDKFIEELLTAMPVYPVSASIAVRTGRLDGENQVRGLRIPLPDLLIGVTALELGYSVGTANLRHLNQIPGLTVVQL